MFRYNAYFGIHTVYYMDLGAHTGKQPLPMPAIILAAVKTLFAKVFSSKKVRTPSMPGQRISLTNSTT